jgi:hypothetical protein
MHIPYFSASQKSIRIAIFSFATWRRRTAPSATYDEFHFTTTTEQPENRNTSIQIPTTTSCDLVHYFLCVLLRFERTVDAKDARHMLGTFAYLFHTLMLASTNNTNQTTRPDCVDLHHFCSLSVVVRRCVLLGPRGNRGIASTVIVSPLEMFGKSYAIVFRTKGHATQHNNACVNGNRARSIFSSTASYFSCLMLMFRDTRIFAYSRGLLYIIGSVSTGLRILLCAFTFRLAQCYFDENGEADIGLRRGTLQHHDDCSCIE